VTVFGEKGILHSEDKSFSYRPLLVQIVKFFQTGNSPVSSAETLEMFAFMEAADLSKKQGGRAIAISEIQ